MTPIKVLNSAHAVSPFGCTDCAKGLAGSLPQLVIDPGPEVLASQLLLCLFVGSSIP